MRLLGLSSLKYFKPLRFVRTQRVRGLKFPQAMRYSRNYLKISLPLSLIGLTYALTQISAKAYEKDTRQQDLKEQTAKFEDSLPYLESLKKYYQESEPQFQKYQKELENIMNNIRSLVSKQFQNIKNTDFQKKAQEAVQKIKSTDFQKDIEQGAQKLMTDFKQKAGEAAEKVKNTDFKQKAEEAAEKVKNTDLKQKAEEIKNTDFKQKAQDIHKQFSNYIEQNVPQLYLAVNQWRGEQEKMKKSIEQVKKMNKEEIKQHIKKIKEQIDKRDKIRPAFKQFIKDCQKYFEDLNNSSKSQKK